jgi:hypothetical protein
MSNADMKPQQTRTPDPSHTASKVVPNPPPSQLVPRSRHPPLVKIRGWVLGLGATCSCAGHAQPFAQPPPPHAAHLLEAADDVATYAAGFALLEPLLPLSALDPPHAFLANLRLFPPLGQRFFHAAQPPARDAGALTRHVQGV